MKEMTEQQWRAFVSDGTRYGKLATVRNDGRPHIAPLWFVLDGDALVFTTGAESVKGRTLVHSGHAALLLHDDRSPYRYVSIEGPVSICRDHAEVLRWAATIAQRYVGADNAEAVGKANIETTNEFLVRLAIVNVTALDELDSL